MNKAKSVAIIGYFGDKDHFTGGQTIKTNTLYNELKSTTDWNIRTVNTFYRKKNPFYLFLKTLIEIIRNRDVIVLLSKNGLQFYLPLLYYATKIIKTRVYHDVIGGKLAGYIDQHPRYVKYLNSFRVNYVETKMIQNELKEKGVYNTEILPNFRRIPILNDSDLKNDYEIPYCFCTFSLVAKEKGIEDAIEAIEEINKEEKQPLCLLDIYGSVEQDYQERFESVMRNATDEVKYCGEVSAEKAVETIKNYYALLFPTYWRSEGQAGTIIESFFAGVPVIATDWRCNPESIKSGFNGILYPGEQAQTLKEAIRWMISQKDHILEMKKNCRDSAYYYLPDKHIKKMIAFIESQ